MYLTNLQGLKTRITGMRIFFYFVVLLFLSNTSFGQTPFQQANNTEPKSNVILDTTKLNLTSKLNEVSKSLSSPYITTNLNIIISDTNAIQVISNKIKKAEKEIEDKEDDTEDLEKNLKRAIAELSKINKKDANNQQKINNLEKNISTFEKDIASLKGELDLAKKERENLTKNLSAIENSFLVLSNQNISIQISEFNYRIAEIDTKINDLSKDLEKVEESNIKLRTWREDKVLGKNDDKELFDIYTKMVRENDKGKKIIEELQSDIATIKDGIKEYEKNKNKIDVIFGIRANSILKDTLTNLISAQNTIQTEINNKLSNLNKKITSSKGTLGSVQFEINSAQENIAKIYKTYKTTEGPKEDNLKTVAGVTQPLSEQGRLVPNISVLGYRSVSDEKSSRAAQLKLFVAPNSEGKNNFNNAYRLLIPEASNYGFLADFSFGFIPSDNSFRENKDTGQPVKKLGLNLSAYYLSKSLAKKDSSIFNTGMLHFKIGMQYVVIGKVLSIYANVNPFYLTDGIKDFQDTYTGYENKLRSFVDFGLNAYLNLSPEAKQNDLFIDLDLGFIAVGGDIKSLVATTDPVIPRIKVSLVKGFRF